MHFRNVSTITECISISAFTSFIGIPIGSMSSAIGLKICAVTAGIRKSKWIIKGKKFDKIVSLAQSKLNRKEGLISKSLTDSSISQNEFVLINN